MTTPTFPDLLVDPGLGQMQYWPAELKKAAMSSELKILATPSSSSSCTFSIPSCTPQTGTCDYTKPLVATPYSTSIREPDQLENGQKIKRPMNAFMVWSQERRAQIANSESKMHNSQISKELGAEWRKMSAEEKAPYIKKAKELRDELLRQHPDYVYRPKRKPRLQPKSVNHPVSPASTSAVKHLERSPENGISTAAAQLLLASEAQKQQSLQHQSLMFAYQTQLLAALLKESQQKKELLSATKQCPTYPLSTGSQPDVGFLQYANNPNQAQFLPADLNLLSTLQSMNSQLNPLLLNKFTRNQIPPLQSFANVNSQ